MLKSQGREGRAGPEAAQGTEGVDEPVLRDLFGVGRGAGQQVGGSEGDVGMQAHKFLVSAGVARPRPFYQGPVLQRPDLHLVGSRAPVTPATAFGSGEL